VTEMPQAGLAVQKDSRRWDFSQRLPVRSGTGQGSNFRKVVAPGQPWFWRSCQSPPEGSARSRPRRSPPLRASPSVPSKVFPGLHGSIGPPSALARFPRHP